jgi:3-oxoacyl-[acyl-carrier protein] reductase
VIINYSASSGAADETAALCKALGGSAEVVGFNVGDSAAVDQALDQLKEKHGKLDILVNNAGISKDGLFIRMKDSDLEETLNVNLKGAIYCARAAAKIMLKARSGRIVNISSVVGEMGNAGQASYVTSKAGLIGLTKALAKELASRNVTVNAVTPGFIETQMTEALDPKVREGHLSYIPLARYGKADEVAKLVSFLVSDDAAYITGQVIGINGGMYM